MPKYLGDLYDFIDHTDNDLVSIKKEKKLGNRYVMRSHVRKTALGRFKEIATFTVGKNGEIDEREFERLKQIFTDHSMAFGKGKNEPELFTVEALRESVLEEVGRYEQLKFSIETDGGDRLVRIEDETGKVTILPYPLNENDQLPADSYEFIKQVLVENYGPPSYEAPERPDKQGQEEPGEQDEGL